MKDIHWKLLLAFIVGHIAAAYGIWLIAQSEHPLVMLFDLLIWYQLFGILGITASAHRLWSHRSYQASLPLRILYMIANSLCMQGSIYWWVRDHRTHHQYNDKEGDPYNAKYGFWYSHAGWVFLKKSDAVIAAGKRISLVDLEADPVVMFQKRWYILLALFCCFILPTIYGQAIYHSWQIGLFVFGFLRWLVVMHATWCINSIAHWYGSQPFSDKTTARNSLIASVIAVGEGWHNYHHAHPSDYRAADGSWITQWNPTSLMLDLLSITGMVTKRKIHQKSAL